MRTKVSAMPDGWEGYLQGGNYQVSRIHVKNGGDGASMTLHVTVPKELTEGLTRGSWSIHRERSLRYTVHLFPCQ